MNPQPKSKTTRLTGTKKKALQVEVLERDYYHCRRCGVSTIAPPHHIILLSQGGSDVKENMICTCTDCHSGLHNGLIKAYGPEDQLVFSLTVAGKIAVKQGKLRPENQQ
jgi:5-methylcytosine-specific restriction endonuclease McrA